jgi:hypothetical protein
MRSRLLITTFSAVLLALLLGSAICAQTKSNTWIEGTWEGTGFQTDDQSTWTMLFTARRGRFSIDYPSLNCGGRWQLINLNAYRARFKERLDHGQDKCTDNGKVVIQRLNKRQILFLYTIAGSREVTASAVLNRRRK